MPATTVRECLFTTRHTILRRTHRAVRTAEEAGCELRPSPLAEPEGPVSWLLAAPRKAAAVSNFNCRKRPKWQIEYTESCHKLFVQSARKYASLVTSKVLSMAIIQGTHTSPAAARRSERLVAELAPPWVSARFCPLRRSLLAFGSNPASRATRTPGTRTHGRVVATSSQPRATRSAM